jgi:ABC-type Fe3+/spermidine/putrescine transport system ATPase subunit
MALLSVLHISKSYDNAPLLHDISFEVDAGEVACLLGPSGTGKTTLLRIIAGLETPEAGQVLFEGRELRGVPVHQRGFGLMFQDLALFPHRNVYENVAFGLRMQNLPAVEIRARVNEALALVGLDPARFAARDVNHLSGGEQQRVALARSLAPRPRFLMFDEPLGALDRILREQLVADLRTLLKRIGMTALYVTHDQEEAFAIADRLVILNAGHVEQIGAPAQVYRQPANAFVARFLGLGNLIPARVLAQADGRIRAATPLGEFICQPALDRASAARVGAEGVVLLRPRAVEKISHEGALRENQVRGTIAQALLQAGHTRLVIAAREFHLTFEWEPHAQVGDAVTLDLRSDEISFLPDIK